MTDGEYERLILLAEECSEVVQAIAKTLRHGPQARHPDYNGGELTNHQSMLKEIADVQVIISLMIERGDFFQAHLDSLKPGKMEKLKKFTHHQFGGGE